jgi:hypothetical protein
MKVWFGFGSEHSMNLVMIGRFKDADSAYTAKDVIDQLTAQLEADIEAGLTQVGEGANGYTDGMLDRLSKVRTHSIGPAEVEQLGYEVKVKLTNDEIVITTEESDVSAYLKIFVEHGARVEVYSAHDYPGTGHGRGG